MLVEQRGGAGILDHQCSGGLSTPERAHSFNLFSKKVLKISILGAKNSKNF
jgi:hypothetical protein